MFPQPYVPTAQCSHSPMFPQPYIPTFLIFITKLGPRSAIFFKMAIFVLFFCNMNMQIDCIIVEELIIYFRHAFVGVFVPKTAGA